jgi:hypothetical protein
MSATLARYNTAIELVKATSEIPIDLQTTWLREAFVLRISLRDWSEAMGVSFVLYSDLRAL